MLRFIPGRPALITQDALVLADLHLGLEHELFGKGVRVGSQMQGMLEQTIELLDQYSPELVIFLGDVKHNVPDTPLEETKDLVKFFGAVSSRARVVITLGNHDGNLARFLQGQKVEIAPAGGFIHGGISFFHGHAWPSSEAMSQKTIIMAHQHPTVEFIDPVGGRHVRKVWCIGKFSTEAKERYPNLSPDAKGIIAPAFNPLTSGAVLNRNPPEGTHGPLMNNKIFKLEESNVYLLDGTPLGSVRSLTPLGAPEGFND